jgi:hypothetical protein
MLIAKVIQKLANFKTFGDEEEYMKPMNSVIEKYIPELKSFVLKIIVRINNCVNVLKLKPENPPPRVRPPIFLEKDLASIHRFLKKNKNRVTSANPDVRFT